jgi:hypothetical protein
MMSVIRALAHFVTLTKGGTMQTKRSVAAMIAALAVALITTVATAHHSLDGQFDQQKPIKIKGVISKVSWVNPHVYFTVDVTDTQGKVTQWNVETVPVMMMKRAGVNAKMLKGDSQPVEVAGFVARRTPNHMFGNKVAYADGHTFVFADFKE